jgi:hypothetical protein
MLDAWLQMSVAGSSGGDRLGRGTADIVAIPTKVVCGQQKLPDELEARLDQR